MKILWAPWRIKYILQEKPKGCIFCIKSKESKDEENLILYRAKYNFVMLNLYPYNNGHLLIAPYRHVPSIEQLNSDELKEMMLLAKGCLLVLRDVMKPDGFNLGFNIGRVAGAGIEEHVHMHIVPRWNGDTNFMPVIGDTKVIPEALKDTYKKLRSRKDIIDNILKEM